MSDYSRISYNGYNYMEYEYPSKITPPTSFASKGEECKSNSDCHFDFYCYVNKDGKNATCDEWNPLAVSIPEKKVYLDRNIDTESYYLCTRDSDCNVKEKCVQNTCAKLDGVIEGFDYSVVQLRNKDNNKQDALKSSKPSLPPRKSVYMSKYNTKVGSNRRFTDVLYTPDELGI